MVPHALQLNKSGPMSKWLGTTGLHFVIDSRYDAALPEHRTRPTPRPTSIGADHCQLYPLDTRQIGIYNLLVWALQITISTVKNIFL